MSMKTYIHMYIHTYTHTYMQITPEIMASIKEILERNEDEDSSKSKKDMTGKAKPVVKAEKK